MKSQFDVQLDNLVQNGYPQAAGITLGRFLEYIEPLRDRISERTLPEADLDQGNVPFVIVVRRELIAVENAMPLVDREGKTGFISMHPAAPDSFKHIESVDIPGSPAYLLLDIDRGRDTINIAPVEALKHIQERKRSPLTIEEGIAILTHYPDFLKKNNCFSLLASRRGDKRVPALWISAGRPKLGWCWDGNPHTWLGSASCRGRTGH